MKIEEVYESLKKTKLFTKNETIGLLLYLLNIELVNTAMKILLDDSPELIPRAQVLAEAWNTVVKEHPDLVEEIKRLNTELDKNAEVQSDNKFPGESS